MTLDETPVGRGRLRRDYEQMEHDDNAGSSEAEAVMAAEYVARMRIERPWDYPATPDELPETLDRRLHGWREQSEWEDALTDSVFRGDIG